MIFIQCIIYLYIYARTWGSGTPGTWLAFVAYAWQALVLSGEMIGEALVPWGKPRFLRRCGG